MKARGEKKYTIVDAVLEERTQALENGFLAKVDKCVNWLKLRTLIIRSTPKHRMPSAILPTIASCFLRFCS